MRQLILILILLVSFQTALLSQPSTDWGAFSQNIDATPYRGKKFVLQAAVKVESIDNAADGEVWVRVDRMNNKLGFFYNMMDKPIRSAEWKIYTIRGTIDNDAQRLVFGGLYHKKGRF